MNIKDMTLEELRDLTFRFIDMCKTLEELEIVRLWVFAKPK